MSWFKGHWNDRRAEHHRAFAEDTEHRESFASETAEQKRSAGGELPYHKAKMYFGFVVFFLLFLALLVAGYGLSSLLFQLIGQPPAVIQYLISFLIAVVLLFLLRGIFFLVSKSRLWQQKEHPHNFYNQVHNSLLATMEQISLGNYNVSINAEESGMYKDLAKAVNAMAKNLGDVEAMRQDFISNVSHEIQSPITSIGGFAALLQDETLTDEQRMNYASIIEAESKRLSSLSEKLLRLSSLEAGKAELSLGEYRLDKQLESIILSMEPQWAGKDIVLEAELSKAAFNGDEELLSQVWINLLHNAIKFTPESGRIRVALLTGENSVCVQISDTGTGITLEDQARLFERFYMADKSRDRALGGNGLGLSLAQKIVELHGGHIFVESQCGEGSTFSVELPTKE